MILNIINPETTGARAHDSTTTRKSDGATPLKRDEEVMSCESEIRSQRLEVREGSDE